MKLLLPIGSSIQYLGLALMVGGILVVGAFVAPVIFKIFPREDAGAALTVIFRRLDILLLIALGGVLLGEALRMASGLVPMTSILAYARYIVLAGLTVMMLISTFQVNPKIEKMQKAGIHPGGSPEGLAFIKTHKLSEQLAKAELAGAALLILLTPFLSKP